MVEKSMMEPDAETYNKLFKKQLDKDADQRLKNQWNRSGFYKIAQRFLPKNKDVIELGCGDGFFTNFLYENQGYIGIDFCTVLIEHGRKLYPSHVFVIGDLREKKIIEMFTDDVAYVCLEVLEHIKNDLDVVKSVPSGSDFIFSVPSADNQFHVRYFTSFDEIKERYNDYLEYLDQDKFPTNYGNVIRVLKARRK